MGHLNINTNYFNFIHSPILLKLIPNHFLFIKNPLIMKYTFFFFLFSFFLFLSCQPELILKEGPQYDYTDMDKQTIDIHKKFERFILLIQHYKDPFDLHPHTRIEDITIDPITNRINARFSKHFAYFPFREENVITLYRLAREQLEGKYGAYKITLSVGEFPIEQLVPNYFRDRLPKDPSRLPKEQPPRMVKPIVTNMDKLIPEKGLYNHNIGLWHSHGWYYDYKKNRWEWQRARLFQTVEDLLPLSFTIPYLIPMLENAGAQVFIPRERDIQTNEVIIDNDKSAEENGQYIELTELNNQAWENGTSPGFAQTNPPYPINLNLFRLGTYRMVESDSVISAKIQWIPNIPEEGYYAVYISYFGSQDNADDVLYTVYHTGGQTRFSVNQQIGGQMWVYLGHFKFKKGMNPDLGRVELVNSSSQSGKLITADAVRFGGGMGNIIRNDWDSRRPRFMEGSRYYLQYNGMPDTLVHNLNKNGQDYINDINSRSEYINYLNGAPNGPNKNRDLPGLGIPIDMTLAFHTDAGIAHNDSTIGTMLIYSTTGADTQTVFPDSVSRIAARDLADIIQTQLLNDIKKTFNPEWTRRRLLDARYSEAFRPNVPGVLLELLSHQNFSDMKFANDPRFRFMVSRAIYKGILKFLSSQYNNEFIIQPLPVNHFQATFDTLGNVALRWQPVDDPLEPTAVAEKYRVYMRIENGGFDNGFIVDQAEVVINDIIPNIIYSFKITALNTGGESFPSEILSVCKLNNDKEPILIVNGFDRICGPAVIDLNKMKGFADFIDQGVPDKFDLHYTGSQFDFDPDSPFRLNDAPGHGASYADYDTKIMPGNTFDFPFIHGQAIKNNGYSFVSCSDEAIASGEMQLENYTIVDWILGEEKETSWPQGFMDSSAGKQFKIFYPELQDRIAEYLNNGGSLFISGAHTGSDLLAGKKETDAGSKFAQDILKFWWITDHAVKTGKVFSVDKIFFKDRIEFEFNTSYDPQIYTVESPDAIGPEEGGRVILRYAENNFSAGIAYQGKYKTVLFGFPFETIKSTSDRNLIIQYILNFFNDSLTIP